MAGRHVQAVDICRAILRGLDVDDDPETYGAVLVRLVSFLDHAGSYQTGIDEVDAFINEMTEQPADLGCAWLRYHKGICLRKLGRLDEAAAIFESLENRDGDFEASCLHQRGVVELAQYGVDPSPRAKSALQDARQFLEDCLSAWEGRGLHREGFTRRRLAQACALAGDYVAAIRHMTKAIEIFASYRCQRYRKEAWEDMEEKILKPLLISAPTHLLTHEKPRVQIKSRVANDMLRDSKTQR